MKMQKKKWKTIWRSNSSHKTGKFLPGPWLITAIVIILCNLFVFRLAVIYGSSMEPTLYHKDLMLIWQLGYNPKNGDIVITDTKNALKQNLVKRVIATEGQTVSISENTVWVDGKPLIETYFPVSAAPMADMEAIRVPDDSVFLMGDNRSVSVDSRTVGCIPNDSILGKAAFRIAGRRR